MPQEYYLNSPQTKVTPAVAAFAETIAPTAIRGEGDLRQVANGVFRHFNNEERRLHAPTITRLAENGGMNSKLAANRVLHDYRHKAIAQLAKSERAHAAVHGVRTADEILRDGWVSRAHACADLGTVVMAVLRHRNVPCRQALVVEAEERAEDRTYTVNVELEIGGKPFIVKPAFIHPHYRVRQAKHEYGGKIVTRAPDALSMGVDLLKLTAILKNTRVEGEAAVRLSRDGS